MKKESKGKPVKTFTAFVPQPDLSFEKTVIQVYFQASHGRFVIWPPEHILLALRDNTAIGTNREAYRLSDEYIFADRIDDVINGCENSFKLYAEILRQASKSKVIRLFFEANDKNGRNDMHFSKGIGLSFKYEILWKVNNILYEQDSPKSALRSKGTIRDDLLVDWTPEREEFFANIKGGILNIIGKLVAFIEDLKVNPDIAISAFPMMMLPPPAAVPVEAEEET